MDNGFKEQVISLSAAICRFFEGLFLKKYYCPAGFPTIGYGHVCREDQPDITEEQAEEMLIDDLEVRLPFLLKDSPGLITDGVKKAAAILDFNFNLGRTRYKASTLKKQVDTKNWPEVEYQLSCWVYANKRKLEGLVKRSKARIALIK